MSSYLSITIYRSRRGRLLAYQETVDGRGQPVELSGAAAVNASILARDVGGQLPAVSREHVMTAAELAEASAAVVARLKQKS